MKARNACGVRYLCATKEQMQKRSGLSDPAAQAWLGGNAHTPEHKHAWIWMYGDTPRLDLGEGTHSLMAQRRSWAATAMVTY